LLADVAGGRGIALLPKSFAGLRRSGVSYRALVEGEELAVGVGLATPRNKEVLRDFLVAGLGTSGVREIKALRAG
jgi:hypothetical protein